MSTSCEQKIYGDGHTSRSGVDVDIDTVSNGLARTTISDDDDELFQDPPSKEECPICMLPIPFSNDGVVCGVRTVYMPCCGKTICHGCAMLEIEEIMKGNLKPLCAFCRVPIHCSNKEEINRLKNRMKSNDPEAFFKMGCGYEKGEHGLPKNTKKALELWSKSGELGSVRAYSYMSDSYYLGRGVAKDKEKAMYYAQLAAIRGHERARYNLGHLDREMGKKSCVKHYMIAASAGHNDALNIVGKGYKSRLITKDEYAKTLRAFQRTREEMKSEERERANSTQNSPTGMTAAKILGLPGWESYLTAGERANM